MLNSEFTRQAARSWAADLVDRSNSDLSTLVSAAYRQAFGRAASEEEVQAATEFVQHQMAIIEGEAEQGTADVPCRVLAITDLCHSLLNANEFLYID